MTQEVGHFLPVLFIHVSKHPDSGRYRNGHIEVHRNHGVRRIVSGWPKVTFDGSVGVI